jgi:hypothetical protein
LAMSKPRFASEPIEEGLAIFRLSDRRWRRLAERSIKVQWPDPTW